MQTQVYTDQSGIEQAAERIKQGELIAFPTETVYGLGAGIFHETAIKKIFEVKGRPSDNPLIAHISTPEEIHTIATDIPKDRFLKLSTAFWPGPLTIVVPKKSEVPNSVTANLPTVAVRMPDHVLALELIRLVGEPLVAPSANISGFPSPTTAQHVQADLDGKIAGIIDGGPCRVGIESTVIDITRIRPLVLRPGAITREQIQEVLFEPVDLYDKAVHGDEKVNSPGLRYRHYAPNAKVILIKDDMEITEVGCTYQTALLLTNRQIAGLPPEIILHPLTMETLYSEFRKADQQQIPLVLIYPDETARKSEGLMNRIYKATSE
jgi:L-threonylcarbamoyladenylate synthase